MDKFDNAYIVSQCRLLGIHATADLDDIKSARNKMAKLYHPDKNSHMPDNIRLQLAEKFKKIQGAYEFLTKNYEKIQEVLHRLGNFNLTSKGHRVNKSHWVYSSVSNL